MKDTVILFAQDSNQLNTPAFICDEQQIGDDIEIAASAIKDDHTKLLFAMKSFSLVSGLERIVQSVDGLHASSLFEAKLARQILGDKGIVHLTTPGLRADEIGEISELCNYISFNSISQWQNMRSRLQATVNCGLRINPQLSLVPDKRYDPCHSHSKLGVTLDHLLTIIKESPAQLAGINGLLLHTNCDASDFNMLLNTVKHLEKNITPLLDQISWINLGGGYLFNETKDLRPLHQVIQLLRRHNLDILFEPGASISRKAGYLVSEVLDIFESEGRQVVILDTTVNHMPEVFEYQFKPDIIGEVENGKYRYLMTGATCLAGDIFGEFTFNEPLQTGSRVIFENAGAYTMVKAHMFNGVNLPTIYALTETGELTLKKSFSYSDYLTHCGV
jgi:carboxynorspermidine decarboxylase